MFGKKDAPKKQAKDEASANAGKGRPTRTRKEAEAANLHPMIPADRKEAKKQRRERQNKMWERQQRAMETGDERYMPERDKGRQRRFTRDFVDARWTVGEFVLPVMLLLIISMFAMVFLAKSVSPQVAGTVVQVITYVTYGLLILSVIESIVLNLQIKKIFLKKHPSEVWKRNWFYTFSRTIMARRWRQPKPQVARGERPEKK